MKIACRCGESILDQGDDLPHKGHLIPDQEWFATLDALEVAVIDALSSGQLGKDAAYHRARQILGRSTRLLWQCRACGRLYVDGVDGQLRCYVPEGEPPEREVLRSRPGRADPGAAADGGARS